MDKKKIRISRVLHLIMSVMYLAAWGYIIDRILLGERANIETLRSIAIPVLTTGVIEFSLWKIWRKKSPQRVLWLNIGIVALAAFALGTFVILKGTNISPTPMILIGWYIGVGLTIVARFVERIFYSPPTKSAE